MRPDRPGRRFYDPRDARTPSSPGMRGVRDPLPGGEDLFLRRVWRSTRVQWHRFAVGAFVIWAAYSLILSPHGWLRLAALKRQVAAEQRQIDALESRRDSLDLVVAQIDRGEKGVLERRAREEFGFARKSDLIYLVPSDTEDDRTRSEAEIHGAERFSDRSREGLTAGRRSP